jgi:hypothetical protein
MGGKTLPVGAVVYDGAPAAAREQVTCYKSSQLMRIVPQFLHTTLQRISSRSVDPQTTQTSGIPEAGGSSSPPEGSSALFKV